MYDKHWYENNKEKHKANVKTYRRKNPHKVSEWNRKLKIETLLQYGGKCKCCEETHHSFLCIDHVAGDGARHRKDTGMNSGSQFYRWLKRNGYPIGFQVLCFNCNIAKHIEGKCPHGQNEN